MKRSSGLAVLFALAVALAPLPGARAEVLDSSAAGFTVRQVQVVPVDAMTAWGGLVDDVHRWWAPDHTWWGDASRLSIQARAGGCFCELHGRRQAQHLSVLMVDPGVLLRMGGGLGPLQGMGLDGTMDIRLAPLEDGGTRITLWYRVGGYSPESVSAIAPAVDSVLGLQMQRLADYLRVQATPPQEER
jgi:hypothetical protein